MYASFAKKIQAISKTAAAVVNLLQKLHQTRAELENEMNNEGTSATLSRKLDKVSHIVQGTVARTERIRKRASSQLQIAFVGATSAGKTTLINALLGSNNKMPVKRGETTFCSVALMGTEKEDESFTLRNTNRVLSYEEFTDVLDKWKGTELRKSLQITPNSVIDMRYPSKDCKALVENVVLYDTPGIGERHETDEAVIELCLSMDVIVAVMDIHRPTKKAVADIVNAVNCKHTFAVFTKRDELQDNTNPKEIERTYKKEFMDTTEGKVQVFFIDSENHMKGVEVNDSNVWSHFQPESPGVAGFKSFEDKLVKAGNGVIKIESLLEEIKSVLKQADEASQEILTIMDERKSEILQRIRRRLQVLGNAKETVETGLDELEQEMKEVLREYDFKTEFLKGKIEEDMYSGKELEVSLQNRRRELNETMKQLVANNERIQEKLREIRSVLKDVDYSRFFKVPSFKPWKKSDFEIDDSFEYSEWNYPRSYVISTCALGTATVATSVALFGWILLIPAGCAAVGGLLARQWWPVSGQKVEAAKTFFETKLRKLAEEKCNESVSGFVSELKTSILDRMREGKQHFEEEKKRVNEDKEGNNRHVTVKEVMKKLDDAKEQLKDLEQDDDSDVYRCID